MVPANERQVGGDHYKSEFQHWDLIARHNVGYLEGCASKYATRWPLKGFSEDVEKGVHYCDKLIELAEEGLRPSGRAPIDALFKFYVANNITDNDEQTVIQCLCQWDKIEDLLVAKYRMELLLVKARRIELMPQR